MSDVWAPVISALGAALLTSAGTFLVIWWQTGRKEKVDMDDRRSRAYSQLLTRSISISHFAMNLHIVMEHRSGLREALNVTLRMQKAIDPLEFTELMRSEMQPLYEAWSEVWVVGSKEAIAEANDLLIHCAAVMGVATQTGQARPPLLKTILGEKWTQAQLDQWEEEKRFLGESRRRFGNIARKEIGSKAANLFSSNEAKPVSVPAPSPVVASQKKIQSNGGRP